MKLYREAQVCWDYTKNEKEVDEPQQWCVIHVYLHITQQGKLQPVSSDTIVYGLKWTSNLVQDILQMSDIVRQHAVK